MSTPRPRGRGRKWLRTEGGSAVVTGAAAIAILMLVFAVAINLVVDEYAKGALRTVVDEAAQAGAEAGGSISACQVEAAQVRASLLPGPLGRDAQLSCQLQGDEVVATANGYLPSLVTPVPRAHISILGFSLLEGGAGR